MARVRAGAALHVLRVHEALQPRQVAEQVAEGEGPGRRRPLQILGRQRLQHPHRAGPGVAPVGEEGGDVLEHGWSIPGTRRVAQMTRSTTSKPSPRRETDEDTFH